MSSERAKRTHILPLGVVPGTPASGLPFRSDLEGFSYAQLAEILELSADGVTSRLSQARLLLRRGVTELSAEDYKNELRRSRSLSKPLRG